MSVALMARPALDVPGHVDRSDVLRYATQLNEISRLADEAFFALAASERSASDEPVAKILALVEAFNSAAISRTHRTYAMRSPIAAGFIAEVAEQTSVAESLPALLRHALEGQNSIADQEKLSVFLNRLATAALRASAEVLRH